jgi:hypothetical protein
MLSTRPIPESQKYRYRAIQYRTMAKLFRLESARDDLLKIATHYELMVVQSERHEIAQGISHLRTAAGCRNLTR